MSHTLYLKGVFIPGQGYRPVCLAYGIKKQTLRSVLVEMVHQTRLELVRLPTRPSNVRVYQFRHWCKFGDL